MTNPAPSRPTLAIASDHGGYALKEALKAALGDRYRFIDLGPDSDAAVDYPTFGHRLAAKIQAGCCKRGILICGTGIGMSIVANRHQHVRAALVTNPYMARMAGEHNDANILVLGGRTTEPAAAVEMVEAWLAAVFAGGRHARRLAQIDAPEATSGGKPSGTSPAGVNGEESIARVDPEIDCLIREETRREEEKLVLIASENYVSRAVLEAQGSILTNKYAEGYPFKRYYGGCQFVDRIEQLAIDRAKELFGADHVNVQPLSGSAANMAVFHSMLDPGDTILGMSLAHGGHLTHGAPISFSGQLYRSVCYGVDRNTHLLDYDEIAAIAKRERPKMIIAGASSYSRTIDFARFREIATAVGAFLLVDMAHIAGLVAAGAHPSPLPYADFVTTTTHKTMRGPRGGMILCRGEYAARIDKAIFPGLQGGPLMHVIAAKAVGFREAMSADFRRTQHQTVANARALAGALQRHGFDIISGGTDNHLMLLNLADLGIYGREAEATLDDAGITVNKNGIPFDTRPPADPGGIRIGTPIVSTRGMGETEMEQIADFIATILRHPRDSGKRREVREQVAELCRRFPVYRGLLSG